MQVIVNRPAIDSNGKLIENLSIELEKNTKQLLNNFDNIEKVWVGNDSVKLITNLKEKCITNLNEMSDVLGEYGTYLKNASILYETFDETFLNKKIDI